MEGSNHGVRVPPRQAAVLLSCLLTPVCFSLPPFFAGDMNPSAGEAELTDPQVILNHYQKLQTEAQQVLGKLHEFESELTEHEQVLQQLRPLNEERKAYRLIGGVLVERSVGDVVPVLEQTSEKLTILIKQFKEAFEKKEIEVRAWKEKYNIRAQTAKEIRAQQQAGAAAAKPANSAASGGAGILA